MILPLLALSATAARSGMAPPEQLRVETVADAVARLTPELGQPVRVSPRLANELIFLARNGASGAVALRSLSVALRASIVAGPRGLVLERTTEDLRRFESERIAERAGWITSRMESVTEYRRSRLRDRPMDAILAEVARSAQIQEDLARGKPVQQAPHFATELLPAETLLLALIEKIGVERIATIPYRGIQVWEDRPVAGALPLPPCPSELARYEAEIAPFRGTAFPKRFAADMDWLRGSQPFFADWAADGQPPTRLRLEVRGDAAGVSIALFGYDGSGKLQLRSGMSARPVRVFRSPGAIVGESMNATKARWVELSPASRGAVEWSGASVLAAPPAWFADPDTNEPLDLFVRETLAALGREVAGQCFVAHVGDDLWNAVALSTREGRVNLDAFEAMLAEFTFYERRQTKEHVVLRPKGRLEPGDLRTSRKALAAFARDVRRAKKLDLRTVARFFARVGARRTFFVYLWDGWLRGTRGIASSQGGAPYHLLRMLGSLSDATWERLAAGHTATIEELGVGAAFGDLLDEDRLDLRSAMPAADIFKQARELYPSADIGSTRISLVTKKRELVGLQSPLGDGTIRWGEVPDPPLRGMTREEYERWLRQMTYQLGTQTELRIVLELPRGMTHVSTFTDPIQVLTELGAYEKLPQAIRDTAWENRREPGSFRMNAAGESPDVRRSPPP